MTLNDELEHIDAELREHGSSLPELLRRLASNVHRVEIPPMPEKSAKDTSRPLVGKKAK